MDNVIKFPGECAPHEFDHPLPITLPLTFMELGIVTMTPGALVLCDQHKVDPIGLMDRFQRGDWGHMDSADHAANKSALVTGDRIMAVYPLIKPRKKHETFTPDEIAEALWVICYPYDHTTILAPGDY